jgi:hypothetical protein
MEKIKNMIKDEDKKELAGEATFEKGTDNKKKLGLIIGIVLVVAFSLFTYR